MDKLTAMDVFLKVVDAGSFATAARRLGISRAMASRHVQELENRLGARLLNRTTRQLKLTEAGAVYYERCTRILADIERTEQAIGELQSQPRGTLRISAPMSFGHLHLASAVLDYMQAYPNVSVDMVLNDRVVDLIEEGCDLAIRIGRLADSSMIARRLATARLVVCASPAYLSARGVPQRPDDLTRHDCLTYAYSPSPHLWRFGGPDGDHVVRVSGSFQANNGDALRVAALRGAGIILQPTFIVGEDLRAGRLRAVRFEREPVPLSIYALYPHQRHLSAKVRSFVDFLARRLRPEPYWDDWVDSSPAAVAKT